MQSDICSFVKMHSVEARRRVFGTSCIPAALPRAKSLIYSHCHHREHVLYYLWNRTGTAHCLSPTSYQEFVPGKSICGEKKTVILEEATAAALRMRTIAGEESRSCKEARGNEAD